MSIRRKIIDYSRGDNLGHFWRLYRLQKKAKNGIMRDILTFFMSRSAHRHGGYIGPDTVILGVPVIGNHCLIGAGAILVGDIKIGDHVKIGAGTVVSTDLPDGCTVVSQPMRVIEKNEPAS